MIRSICLMLVALALTSCASPKLRVTDIPIAKGATFDLMSPASLGQSISLEQIVDAKYGDKEFSFHCLLEVDPKQLVLVGMTPMNTRAFTLTLSGEEFTIDMAPGAQLPADPSRILADLQLALWPEPKVKGLMRGMIAHDFDTPADVRAFNRLKFEEDPVPTDLYFANVVEIHYAAKVSQGESPWAGPIEFRNNEQNYTLRVKTIRAEILAP